MFTSDEDLQSFVDPEVLAKFLDGLRPRWPPGHRHSVVALSGSTVEDVASSKIDRCLTKPVVSSALYDILKTF